MLSYADGAVSFSAVSDDGSPRHVCSGTRTYSLLEMLLELVFGDLGVFDKQLLRVLRERKWELFVPEGCVGGVPVRRQAVGWYTVCRDG